MQKVSSWQIVVIVLRDIMTMQSIYFTTHLITVTIVNNICKWKRDTNLVFKNLTKAEVVGVVKANKRMPDVTSSKPVAVQLSVFFDVMSVA